MNASPEKTSLITYVKSSPQLFDREVRTLIVVVIVSLAQGLIISCDTIWSYVYKDDYHLEPAYSSSLAATLSIPWMIKPLWGILSDNFPIFGYRRKAYLIIMSFLAWVAFINFGLWVPPLALGITLLMILNISVSFQSVVAQAIIVENAQEISRREGATDDDKAKAASTGISIFYGTKLVGKVIFALFMMFLLTEDGRRNFLFGTSFVPVGVLVVSFLLPEIVRRYSEPVEPADDEIVLQATLEYPLREELTTFSGNQLNSRRNNYEKTIAFIKHRVIYRSMLLMFASSFVPGPGQAKFYFLTNFIGFSASFMGSLSLVSCAATVIGVLIYNKFFSKTSLRKVYTFTTVMCSLLTLSQLILIYRWNLQLGIPDKVFAALDTFVANIGDEINGLPLLVLACRICPKDIEATIFAVMLACSNAGGIISGQIGALLVGFLGITAENFDNLDIITMIAAIFQIMPLILLWTYDYEKAMKEIEDMNQNNVPGEQAASAEPEKINGTENKVREDDPYRYAL